MMTPKKGGIKDKLNAAIERMNAGRQAKLGAKSDVAYAQGNLKKGAKLDMRSKKVALRSEKRQAVNDAKMNMKMGKMPKLMMKSTSTPMSQNNRLQERIKSQQINPIERMRSEQQEMDAIERAKKYRGGQY